MRTKISRHDRTIQLNMNLRTDDNDCRARYARGEEASDDFEKGEGLCELKKLEVDEVDPPRTGL